MVGFPPMAFHRWDRVEDADGKRSLRIERGMVVNDAAVITVIEDELDFDTGYDSCPSVPVSDMLWLLAKDYTLPD